VSGSVRDRPLVSTDLGLALPIALVQGSDEVLEWFKTSGLADPSDLIFQPVGKTFVVLASERLLVPTSAPTVVIEVHHIVGNLGRVLVPKHLKTIHGVGNGIMRTEKVPKFRQELGIGFEPFGILFVTCEGFIELRLEPIKQITLEVGERVHHSRMRVGKVIRSRRHVH
jgi:hypothetical protein